jgi:hypothetical protein
MGSLVVTERPSACVSIQIDGLAAGDRVRVVEQGRETALYQATGPGLRRGHPVALAGDAPHPVRIEVRDAGGADKVFSNPITFLRRSPPEGLPAARASTR